MVSIQPGFTKASDQDINNPPRIRLSLRVISAHSRLSKAPPHASQCLSVNPTPRVKFALFVATAVDDCVSLFVANDAQYSYSFSTSRYRLYGTY